MIGREKEIADVVARIGEIRAKIEKADKLLEYLNKRLGEEIGIYQKLINEDNKNSNNGS